MNNNNKTLLTFDELIPGQKYSIESIDENDAYYDDWKKGDIKIIEYMGVPHAGRVLFKGTVFENEQYSLWYKKDCTTRFSLYTEEPMARRGDKEMWAEIEAMGFKGPTISPFITNQKAAILQEQIENAAKGWHSQFPNSSGLTYESFKAGCEWMMEHMNKTPNVIGQAIYENDGRAAIWGNVTIEKEKAESKSIFWQAEQEFYDEHKRIPGGGC